MPLKNLNPTSTNTWKKLEAHFLEMQSFSLKKAFESNPNRKDNFSIKFNDISFDYSKNIIKPQTLKLLIELADSVNLKDGIDKYFCGDIINVTEKRAVLHTALRSNFDNPLFVDGKDIRIEIKESLNKIRKFSNKVISGQWKGFSGDSITDVVNIGIGGSDLGPDMVLEALKFTKTI